MTQMAANCTQEPVPAHWYLLQSRPRQERRALENLRNQGFRCLLPLYSRERLRRGQRMLIDEPLFPRYLFVHLDPRFSNWSALRSTYGVSQLVSFGGQPAAVPTEVIDALTECRPANTPLYQPGDRVRITSGAFADLEGIYEQDDGETRVVILMQFMTRERRLSFPIADTRKQ
jgi:transcriptional antiterminator RfaH